MGKQTEKYGKGYGGPDSITGFSQITPEALKFTTKQVGKSAFLRN